MDIKDCVKGFTFGCDPELFITNEEGKFVSAAGLIPGTKEEPYKVEFGAVQVDGMAAEFNIDPASSFLEWDRNIKQVLRQLASMLPKGYNLNPIPAVEFEEAIFDSAPDDAKVLGCNPDFNAWTGEVNMPPNTGANPFLRTASGHIHVGWSDNESLSDPQHLMNCRDLVKQLDWYLGGWSLMHDKDATRRLLYGQAGACRYKPYGVEYRVLSNFWISQKTMRLTVWNRLQAAIRDMKRAMPIRVPVVYNDMLVASINTSAFAPMFEKEFRFPISTYDSSFTRY